MRIASCSLQIIYTSFQPHCLPDGACIVGPTLVEKTDGAIRLSKVIIDRKDKRTVIQAPLLLVQLSLPPHHIVPFLAIHPPYPQYENKKTQEIANDHTYQKLTVSVLDEQEIVFLIVALFIREHDRNLPRISLLMVVMILFFLQ